MALPSTWMAVGVALVTLYGPSLLGWFHFLRNTLKYTWSPGSTPLGGSSSKSDTVFFLLEYMLVYASQLSYILSQFHFQLF